MTNQLQLRATQLGAPRRRRPYLHSVAEIRRDIPNDEFISTMPITIWISEAASRSRETHCNHFEQPAAQTGRRATTRSSQPLQMVSPSAFPISQQSGALSQTQKSSL